MDLKESVKYKLIYIYYIFSSLFIIGLMFFIDEGKAIRTEDIQIYHIFAGLSAITIAASFFVKNIFIRNTKEKDLLPEEQQKAYLLADIVKWALLEAVVIYGLIVLFMTGDRDKSVFMSLVGFLFLLLRSPASRSI